MSYCASCDASVTYNVIIITTGPNVTRLFSRRLFPSQQGLLSLISHCADSRDEWCSGSFCQINFMLWTYVALPHCCTNNTGANAHIHKHTHHCFLSILFRTVKPLWWLHHSQFTRKWRSMNPSFWCLMSWCFPGNQRDRPYNTYRSLRLCVCLSMCYEKD